MWMSDEDFKKGKELEHKMLKEPISLDEYRLVILSNKFELQQRLRNKEILNKEIIRQNFDNMNHNDYSFIGYIKKGWKGFNHALTHMSSGLNDMTISLLENTINEMEKQLHEWESNPKAKEAHDKALLYMKEMHNIHKREETISL